MRLNADISTGMWEMRGEDVPTFSPFPSALPRRCECRAGGILENNEMTCPVFRCFTSCGEFRGPPILRPAAEVVCADEGRHSETSRKYAEVSRGEYGKR